MPTSFSPGQRVRVTRTASSFHLKEGEVVSCDEDAGTCVVLVDAGDQYPEPHEEPFAVGDLAVA